MHTNIKYTAKWRRITFGKVTLGSFTYPAGSGGSRSTLRHPHLWAAEEGYIYIYIYAYHVVCLCDLMMFFFFSFCCVTLNLPCAPSPMISFHFSKFPWVKQAFLMVPIVFLLCVDLSWQGRLGQVSDSLSSMREKNWSYNAVCEQEQHFRSPEWQLCALPRYTFFIKPCCSHCQVV